MRILFLIAVSALLLGSPAGAAEKLVVKQSPHTVSETLDRLTAAMQDKGITIFARFDHASGAEKAGLELRPTQVLVFGNPKLGTPLMQTNQEVGVDLPLRALAWKGEDGKVWLGYTPPAALKARYGIEGRDEVFKKMTGALDKLTSAAVKAK